MELRCACLTKINFFRWYVFVLFDFPGKLFFIYSPYRFCGFPGKSLYFIINFNFYVIRGCWRGGEIQTILVKWERGKLRRRKFKHLMHSSLNFYTKKFKNGPKDSVFSISSLMNLSSNICCSSTFTKLAHNVSDPLLAYWTIKLKVSLKSYWK